MPFSSSSLSIALLGTRGIPGRYGGFETFAEELSTRLVARGHKVVVYGRHRFGEKPPDLAPFKGVERTSVPTVFQKYLETPLSSLMSLLRLWLHPCEVALLCNAANSPFAWIGRLRGIPIAINVDGIERHRSKWNWVGKTWYRLGEFCSVLFASEVIADAQVIADYYQKQYRIRPSIIAYGAQPDPIPAGEVLKKFGVEAGKYLLYVSRFEPENNALGVLQAYATLPEAGRLPLVMVGDAPYANEYKAKLQATAVSGVVFTGYQFAEAYRELRTNCYAYIQATEVGGTHPALVEAMAYGNCVIANATPENIEVLGQAGLYYEKNNFGVLAQQLKQVHSNPAQVQALGQAAAERARQIYQWDKITDQYEQLFLKLAKKDSSK